MTMEEIIIVVTALVTLIFGELAKRFKWVKKKYIPYRSPKPLRRRTAVRSAD